TMALAQQLYEGVDIGKEGTIGLITYMRTDSSRVSETAQAESRKYIREKFGEDYLPKTVRKYKQKSGAQDAHEAIRPTSVFRTPAEMKKYLSRDQYRLYKLIWERFVASQMAAAVYDVVSADIRVGEALFKASGSKIRFPGFIKVYVESNDDNKKEEDKYLPELTEGQMLKRKSIDPKQHFTQPPPRYTEASLVKELEDKGIGRPSTYAPILDTIQKRGYVLLEEKRFVPSELGEIVIDLIGQFFPDILNITFTARMEEDLDLIEEGKANWIQVLDDFYNPFKKQLLVAEKEMAEVEIKDEVSDEVCEKCGSQMVYKFGRFGKFLACSAFPECRNTKPILKPTGVACPKCKTGEIVERKSKKSRLFYGCSRYPDCDFVSWDRPVARPCPKCGQLMTEKKAKKKPTMISCTACDYEEEKK
ncbi:MAG: type I DNA topoisomerase, partial [Thermoactinomyces sp.]